MPASDKKYKRILLKLSGEALMGDEGFGIDFNLVCCTNTRTRRSHADAACSTNRDGTREDNGPDDIGGSRADIDIAARVHR